MADDSELRHHRTASVYASGKCALSGAATSTFQGQSRLRFSLDGDGEMEDVVVVVL